MRGYKVVRNYDGVRRSFTMRMHATTYFEYKYAFPRKGFGALAVFDTLENATDFLVLHTNYDSDAEIWEVDFIKSKGKYLRNRVQRLPLSELPEGTILASKVKLVRLVRRVALW